MRSVLHRFAHAHKADLVIVLVVLLAYWPLTSFQLALTDGDTMNCWLPWRWAISTSLFDGAPPWWNPLQQMGYPQHADLQGPAWYVEAIALGGTIGMGPAVLQVLFLGYLITGGWGMKRMAARLTGRQDGALLAAMAYSLSGFFTAHTMHFYAIISAAWLPWVFWALMRMIDAPEWRSTAWMAVFSHLLLTGGNHTFLLIAAYPLAALVIHGLWTAWRRGGAVACKPLVLHGMAAMFLIAITSAGTLHAVLEVGDHVARLGGLPLEQAQQNPMTLPGAASTLLPAMATASPDQLGTDATMANAYFGLVPMLLAALALPFVRGGRAVIFLTTAFICGLASLGPATPVHVILWRFVPGMDLFRFPSYFWYFLTLGVLPWAAEGFHRTDEPRFRLRALRGAVGTIVVLAVLAVIVAVRFPAEHLLYHLLAPGSSTWPARVLQNTILFALLCLAAVVVLGSKRDRRWLLLIVAAEGFLAVHFTSWSTSLNRIPPADLQARIDLHPRGPVFPELHAMVRNKDGDAAIHPFWLNTRNFQNGPSHDGFNSFWLQDHQKLTGDHALLYASMQQRPWLSLTDDVRAIPAQGPPPHDTLADRRVVWVQERADAIPSMNVGASSSLELLAFDHQGFSARTTTAGPSFLLVQQNRYPGWTIRVDGAEAPVIGANLAAFGTWVPAGSHLVDVRYDRPMLRWLLITGHGGLFLLLLFLSWSSAQRWPPTIATLFLLGAWCWSMFGHTSKTERIKDQWQQVTEALQGWPAMPVVVNTDRPLPGGSRSRTLRVDAPDQLLALEHQAGTPLPDTLISGWHGLPLSLSMRAFLQDHYAPPLERAGATDAGAWLLVKGRNTAHSEVHSSREVQVLVSPERPYSPAFRTHVGELKVHGGDHLIVDLRYRSGPGAKPRLVMERKQGERTMDYEAVALEHVPADGEFHAAYIVRPMAIYPGNNDELGIYLWNDAADTLWIKDIRIRVGKVMQ